MGDADTLHIGHEVLEAALLRGGRVDASARILNGSDKVVLSDGTWGAHLATPMIPSGDLDPLEIFGRGVPPPSPTERMSPRRFEMLSLAARVRSARDAQLAWGLEEARTDAERKRRESENLTAWNQSPLAESAAALGLNLKGFAEVQAEHLQGLLAWACDELGPDQGRRGTARTHEQLAMRAGLQLIGCRITSTSADGLRLVNARFPFSLRLIGCVVDCPILLAHTQLVTLDLSGSSMTGLDAGGLRAGGNVHLRRAVVTSQVTLAGAQVEGNLNAAQMVVAPFRPTMAHAPVETEHGIVNLSKIDVGGEVTLTEARIWGGLSLRGAKLGRSLSLTGAVVVSPLGLFEKRVAELLERAKLGRGRRARVYAGVDRAMARRRHLPPAWAGRSATSPMTSLEMEEARRFGFGEVEHEKVVQGVRRHVGAKQTLERLDYEDRVWGTLAEDTLRHLDPRSLMSAIRADGMQVAGTVFARAAVIYGRLRLRYARIDGSVRLEGSLLRSAESIGRACAEMVRSAGPGPIQAKGEPAADLIQELQWAVTARKGFEEEGTAVALDMRDTHVVGGVMMGRDLSRDFLKRMERRQGRKLPPLRRQRQDPTEFQGNLLMKGFVTQGDLILAGAHFTPLANSADFDLIGPLKPLPHLAEFEASGAPTAASLSLRAENADIAGDLDLRGSHGLWGLDLQNAVVGGDVKFSDKASLRDHLETGSAEEGRRGAGERWVTCEHRARQIRGEIDLRGATIGGDALLVFSPGVGPIIKAGLVSVKGRLGIHPQAADGPQDEFLLEAPPSDPPKTGTPKDVRYIDLRHARCSVFIHPTNAWPADTGLSLDGFKYEQAHEIGPLAPHPYPASDAAESKVRLGLASGAAASIAFGLAFWFAAAGAAAFMGKKLILHSNTGIALFFSLGLAASYWLTRWLAERWVERKYGSRRPGAKDLRPRAIAYLSRQRRLPNRFRLFEHHHPVMDTYLQAAHALRSAGRFHAGNAVEQERLRVRASNLSWRHHGVAKALLKVVDWVSAYGFDLSRTAMLFAALVLFAAMLADFEASAGRLEHKHDAAFPFVLDDHPDPDVRPGLWYGLDLILPIDLGAVDAWEAPEQGAARGPFWRLARLAGLSDWRSIFALLGLMLSTIFGLALASRAESALANVKE